MFNRGKEQRPIVNVEIDSFDRIIEGLAFICLFFMWVYLLYKYRYLPEIIPTHFDVAGHPDDYGSKLTIWALPGIATIITIVFTALNRIPHTFNFPVKITLANAERQYRLATKLLRFLKLSVVLIFMTIMIFTIRVAEGGKGGQGFLLIFVILGLTIIPVIIYLIHVFRK